MDTNLASLIVPREDARRKIQERIEKGKEIFKMPFILLRDDLWENEQIDFTAVFSDESEAVVNLFRNGQIITKIY